MRKTLLFIWIIVSCTCVSYFQQPGTPAPWNVSLTADTTAASTITVANQCRSEHEFQIQTQNAPFLTVSVPRVQVAGGQTRVVAVQFNTNGLAPGQHSGQANVVCLTCRREPTCTQDREVLQIALTVTPKQPQPSPTNPPGMSPQAVNIPASEVEKRRLIPRVTDALSAFLKGPCPDKENECEKLRQRAAELEQTASEAQASANAAKQAADDAEKKAANAEKAARDAERAAQTGPTGGTIAADGETFSEADNAWLEQKRQKLLDDWKSGKISAEEQQAKRAELSGPDALKKAREERLAKQAELKKEAEAKRREADAARAAAEKERKAADEAQKAADEAKRAADKALEEYKKCLKEIEDECRRQTAAREAEERRRRDAEAAVAAAAEKEAAKKKADEEAAKTRAAEQAYLLDNIKKLGLISSSPYKDTPGAFDALIDKVIPDILGKTAEQWVNEMATMAAEEVGKAPVPLSTIQAIGGLYQVAAALLDPCTAAGMSRTVERLQKMTNPKTNRNYTLDEALDKTEKMCRLLNELKAKIDAIKKLQKK